MCNKYDTYSGFQFATLLLRKKKYKGVKKIIITICFVTGLYILLQIIMFYISS